MMHKGRRAAACSPAPTLAGAVEIDIHVLHSGGGSGSSTDADSPLVMHGQLRLGDKAGYEESAGGGRESGWRVARGVRFVWGAARRMGARGVGEERVPYLALLWMRATRAVPGGQYLAHPRAAAVAGGVAAVAPAVGAAVLEKRLADELGFHYPVFMQIAVLGTAAVLAEALTGEHGLFVRAPSVRTGRLLPLVGLYVAATALGHAARRTSAAHAAHPIVQAALPIAVILLLLLGDGGGGGFGPAARRTALDAPIVRRASLTLSRGLRGMRHGLVDRGRAALGAAGVRVRELGSGSSSSNNSSTASLHRLGSSGGGGHDGDTEAPWGDSRCAVRGTSSASNLGGLAYGRDARSTWQGHEADTVADGGGTVSGSGTGRGLVAVLAVLTAAATWMPRQTMVSGGTAVHWAQPGAGAQLARGALSIALSAGSMACNAAMLVGISSQLRHRRHQQQQQPGGHSSTAFVRHFAPLCMLGMLMVWPLLEQPVDALAEMDARRLAACAAVAVLGAISLIARTAALAAPVSDGPVGVAAFAQFKTLACLAVGWWAFGYAHSWPQLAAFAAACACAAAWAACRLLVRRSSTSELLPAAPSPRILCRPPRLRKCSSAGH
ncbi:hypothetical protein H4R19_000352 [Coemansia spiralis]|nr:hypothetical protein H4R19_000352 [Coemansia spiralis]